MMRTIAVVALMGTLSGCVSYRASRDVAIIGGLALAGGIVAGSTDPDSGEGDQHAINGHEAAAIELSVVGLVLGLSGLIAMSVYGKPTTPAPPPTTASLGTRSSR